MTISQFITIHKNNLSIAIFSLLFMVSSLAHAEWNAEWTVRNKISINSQGLAEAAYQAPVLVRLHSGNFDFTSVNIDGSDIRFIAADDKTELKYDVEKL